MQNRSPYAFHWALDQAVTFLNHGSFGATPKVVLAAAAAWRDRLEQEPVRFFVREWQEALDHARLRLCDFLEADPEGLVFVPNATSGVNAALRSYPFKAGDQILITNHIYNACRNAAHAVAKDAAADVVTAEVPFPLSDPGEVIERIQQAITSRTRLLLIDHITSPTGLIFPLEAILKLCQARGIHTLVDGAHAPGMIPLHINALAPTWYTGNTHKWMCAPKGVAFLWTHPEWRARTRPLVISHGTSLPAGDRSRYQLEFDWPGTHDPSNLLALPTAIDFLASLHPEGWPGIRRDNRALAIEGRRILLQALGREQPAPDAMIGAMVAMPIPDGPANPPAALYSDPLQDRLWHRHRIEVPIGPWPKAPRRLLRISAHLHNAIRDYESLAGALLAELREERGLG